MNRRRAGVSAVLAMAIALAACKKAAPDEPEPVKREGAADRGRGIYERGVSPSGKEIAAEVAGGMVVPAAAVPCINCHGRDGRGKAEGGIFPSDVRWEALAQPYAVVTKSGRRRTPYSEHTLVRAVSMGVDSAGQPLNNAMPRYRFSRADVDDLIAYLKTLGSEPEPGVTDTEVRVGTVLAGSGALAAQGQAAVAALEAFFDEVNRSGGIYGRRVALRIIDAGTTPEEQQRAVAAFLDRERPLALTALFVGNDDGIAAAVEERRIPLVGAMSLYPRSGAAARRYVFDLYAGIAEQGEILAEVAAREPPPRGPVAIVHPSSAEARDAALRIAARCRLLGLGEAKMIEVAGAPDAALAKELSRARPRVVFFLGPAGQERLLWDDMRQGSSRPLFLAPGAVVGDAIFTAPPALADRILLSFPALLPERAAGDGTAYRALSDAHRLPKEHLTAQLSALAAAQVLVEGLKRIGREVTGERLVEALEGLRGFETGFVPPIAYDATRRIGTLDVHVVGVDLTGKRFVPLAPSGARSERRR